MCYAGGMRPSPPFLWTGLARCYDTGGMEVPCAGSGQDAEARSGLPWPEPRFETHGDGVLDRLTALVWHPEADLGRGPVAWEQALEMVSAMRAPGGPLWRLPTINELESLVDASRHSPALPAGHPFRGAGEACWSSTTSFYEPDWSYVLYLHKGAVGVGYKALNEFLTWPVYGPLAV